MKLRHETCSDIFKLKNVCIYKTSELAERQLSAQIETKWLVAKQVMQSVNCTPARRLKMCW